MQLRSWDKGVQMRPDKPEALCPVFLSDGSWWVTCILVNPLFLLTFVFPSPGSEVQAPTYAQAGPGFLLLPRSHIKSLSLSILLFKCVGSIVGQPDALCLQYPPRFTPTVQHSPGSSAAPVWHPLEGGENAIRGWEATQTWPCLLACLTH